MRNEGFTSVWSVQQSNSGQNIQQVSLLFFSFFAAVQIQVYMIGSNLLPPLQEMEKKR